MYMSFFVETHTHTQTQNPHTFHSYNHIRENQKLTSQCMEHPFFPSPSIWYTRSLSQAAKSPPGQLGADTALFQPGFHLVI